MGTIRDRSGEIAEMLERRSVEICCVHQTRFRGKSLRMISEKAVNYKLFRIGNEKGLRGLGIFTAKKKLDKVIDTSRIRDRIIAFKVFAQGIINSVISVKVPQFGSDRKKDIFYDSLSNIVRKVKKKKIVGSSMVTVEVMQKIMWTSMEVMVMELTIRKGKDSGVLCSYKFDNRENNLQK